MGKVQNSISYMEFLNHENQFRHHYYEEEMKQYELLKVGDEAAILEARKMFSSSHLGHLSNDPLLQKKYLFVASVTLATRFAIEGGMNSETAYNTSDYYIRQLDFCYHEEDVTQLHSDMFSHFTHVMANIQKETVFSKPVVQCLDYIDRHLHVPISVTHLSNHVSLHPNYLSTLFKKETGVPISCYVMQRRIEVAKNMLISTDYSPSKISEILSFSSQSYFIKCFKKLEGMTPNEYRKIHFRQNFSSLSRLE